MSTVGLKSGLCPHGRHHAPFVFDFAFCTLYTDLDIWYYYDDNCPNKSANVAMAIGAAYMSPAVDILVGTAQLLNRPSAPILIPRYG